jgi:hypothetical protein
LKMDMVHGNKRSKGFNQVLHLNSKREHREISNAK